MEVLNLYLSGDGYCSVCLRGAAEARLLRATDVNFFAAVQVNQVTPYLCAWCRARLRAFHHMRGLVLRSQYWLYSVHHSQSFLPETNKQSLLSELDELKKDILKTDRPLSAAVSCEPSFSDHRSVYKSEETSYLVEVKLDPETRTEAQNRETDIKMDADIGTWADWKLSMDADQDSVGVPETLARSPEIICDGDAAETISSSRDKTREKRPPKKRKARYTSNLRKTGKISEANNRVVYLDELDDVGHMLADVMKEKIRPTMLSEPDYWRLHAERLTKPQYTNLPHQCAKCAMAYQKEELYKKHMERHSPHMGTFSCHLCGTYHRTRSELTVHGSSHLRRYRCAECGHTGYNRQDVANHYFAEHSLLRFHCRYCHLQSKGPFLVREHILTKHKKRNECAEECPICKKMIKQRNRVRHASSHEIGAPLRCATCGREFKNEACLRQHVSKFHTVRPESLEECGVCKKTIPSRGRAAHMRQHSQAEPAFCADCQKTFTSTSGLKAHRERVHSGSRRRFTCDVCGAGYTSKAAVRRHISFLHTKLGGVGCGVCGKMFSHVGDMRSHERSVHQKHLARRDKLCDLCGKGFITTKTLENHRLIHTGEKPHACRDCGQTFRQRAALQTHHKLKHLRMKMKDILSRRRRRAEGKGGRTCDT